MSIFIRKESYNVDSKAKTTEMLEFADWEEFKKIFGNVDVKKFQEGELIVDYHYKDESHPQSPDNWNGFSMYEKLEEIPSTLAM